MGWQLAGRSWRAIWKPTSGWTSGPLSGKLLDASMKIKRAEAESERLKQAVLVNGRAITRGEISALRDSIRSVESAQGLQSAAAESEKEALAEAVAAEKELSGCIWKTEAEASAAITEAVRLEGAVKESKLPKKAPGSIDGSSAPAACCLRGAGSALRRDTVLFASRTVRFCGAGCSKPCAAGDKTTEPGLRYGGSAGKVSVQVRRVIS